MSFVKLSIAVKLKFCLSATGDPSQHFFFLLCVAYTSQME
uniref:Uncharacterized protein n=1 Tax=Arundo donax TaxID=35708 RepID=A0A0A9BAS6_ARUDO